MNKTIRIASMLLMTVLMLGVPGCGQKKLRRPPTAGNVGGGGMNIDEEQLDKFAESLSDMIAKKTSRELRRLNPDLIQVDLEGDRELVSFYRRHQDAFKILPPSRLPKGLKWQDGSDLKAFASTNAVKGGTFFFYMADYPRTLRYVGPDANGSFRQYILDNNVVSLLEKHPNEDGRYFPGLAREWAIGADNRTVYFRLDPDARYSDGQPVRVTDFFFHFYFMRNDHLKAPWYKDYYSKERFPNITIYDKETFSITFFRAAGRPS